MSNDSTLPIDLDELLARSPDAVVAHDIESNVLFWNQAAEKLYGWTFNEIQGRPVEHIFYLDSSTREDVFEELCDQGAWEGELRQIDREGNEYLVRSRQCLVRDAEGNPSYVLAYNTDITQLKKQQDAEERARQVRSSSILAGGVAHELNNALAPIMLSSAILKRSIEDPKAKNMVVMIEKCANKGAELVAELLAFERGRGGGLELIGRTQVERAIKRACSEFVTDRIKLKCDVAEDLWDCRGEPAELVKVYRSVIQNACEAMPDEGVLQIQVGNRVFDKLYESLAPEAKAGAYLSLVFTDTGFGIEKHLLHRVAEPFFTTKEPKKGHGFGLSRTQAIIKGHKGFMVIESEHGQGTTLSIFIPADSSEEKVKGSTPLFPVTKTANGQLVLVVDDEFFIRETIKKTLQEYGYNVITAQDGAEAQTIFASRICEIDLVITNVEMPFMDGLALCRVLKKLKPDARVLVSSGHQQPSKIQEIKSSGVHHFLAKPYTADILADTVHAILSEQA